MYKELAPLAKKYNFLQSLQVGTYVDAIDEKKWKVARIISIKTQGHKHLITLHFDGFPDSWDEIFQLPSANKLAPFRSKTVPITIELDRSTFRPPASLNFQSIMPILQKIMKQNKQKLKAEWIIQKLRGEVLIFVEALLTQSIKMKGEQFEDILSFFEKYIEVCIHVLNFAIEKISDINKDNITDANIIYVSQDHALLSSLPEVLFSLNSLITIKQRRIKFYSLFESSGDTPRKRIKNFLIQNDIIKLCKAIIEWQGPQGKGFPWSAKKQALVLLSNFEEIQLPKINDQKQIAEVLDILSYLKAKQALNEETVESTKLDLICTQITLGNFEGKLKGLNELKKVVDSFYKKQYLKEKIFNSNLLNALTDNSTFNGQIFKRSLPYFEAAYKQNILTDEILIKILALHEDKHELQLKSFYATLAEFGQFLHESKLVWFFNKFEEFPLDVHKIGLIKDYTLNIITKHPVLKKKYEEPGFGFGFPWLLNVIKDPKNSQEIVNCSIEALGIIGKDIYYQKSVQACFVECFSNIKQGNAMQTSLKIIHTCINKNAKYTEYINKIDKQFSVVDSVIKPLIEANHISNKLIQTAFDFLEQVNQFIQKGLTVDHIKSLWKIKQCRTCLFKFMRKHQTSRGDKSSDKILNKRLDHQEVKEIITKIFMNKALMDNYSDISEEIFQTIDELLIFYNYKIRSIDFSLKKTIRCININILFGLQLYIEIGMNTKNQNISKNAFRRFIEFYLRPTIRTNNQNVQYQEKVKLWLAGTDSINKLMGDSPKKYVVFGIFFEELKGRMKSLIVTQQSIGTLLVEYKNKSKNQIIRKNVSLPRYSTLWKLRNLISTQFNIGHINFQMMSPNGKILDMETEEEYSLLVLNNNVRELDAVSIYVTENNEKHHHTLAIEQFKSYFSQTYGQKCYQNLGALKNASDQLLNLQILQSVPDLKSIQQKFLALEIGKQLIWDQVLDRQSRPKLSYQLSIINKVKTAGKIQWIQNFIKKGGVQHIEKILKDKNKSTNKNGLTLFDYKVLLQLMSFFNETVKFYRLVSMSLCFNQESITEFLRIPSSDKKNKELVESQTFLDYYYTAFQNFNETLTYTNIDGKKVIEDKNVKHTLELLLFTPVKTEIQSRFPTILEQIIRKSKGETIFANFAIGFFDLFFSNPNLKNSCETFFNVIVLLFDKSLVANNLFNKMIEFIKKIRYSETNIIFQEQNGQTNELVHGWLRLIKCFQLKKISSKANWQVIPETEQKFAKFLITEGLFKQGHLFQSEKCRDQAFEVLSSLSCSKQIMFKISNQVNPILTKAPWRKYGQWFVRSFKKRQKQTRVGLKNLAATCYINSLLQQLYFVKQFSEPLLSLNTKEIETKQNIVYEIQKIFAYLKYSNREVYTTETLCMNFIVQGQPIDPRVQMDVDQFFHTLLDKLEQNLMKINKQNLIDDVFRGEFSNLIIGQQCGHKSERVEHFMSMRLEIINKSSLTQALAEFIKGQVLEGQNAYFCEKCDKKIKALKRVCVKSLPDTLILTLKRFQFDYDRMEKFKLNSYCEFSEQLDMSPYMRDTLFDNEEKLDPSKYKYQLKGVIIHYGISEAGHYTSYIKLENNEWKYFDDDKISDFDFKDFGKECFGGVQDNSDFDNSERMKNAYVLFYERVDKQSIPKANVDLQIKSEVDVENLNNEKVQILFNSGLQTFFNNNALSLAKTYLIYTHVVTLRSEDRQKHFKKSYQMCVAIFQSSQDSINWYLNNFSESMIKEFLIYGYSQSSFFVASLLIFCLKRVVNTDFIKRCIKCIERKNMVPLNKIFQAAAQSHQDYGKVMSEQSFVDKIMAIIKQDKYGGPGALSRMTPISSEFGEPFSPHYPERKDYRSSIQLLKCIQSFKVKSISTINDVQFFIQRAKKLSVQNSLAILVSNRFKSQQDFHILANNLLNVLLCQYDPNFESEYIFKFGILLVWKCSLIQDGLTSFRNKKLAEIYINAIKDSLGGYKAMRYLLEGLFSISFNNTNFRDEIVALFSNKQYKKYVKSIRDWMKDSQRFGKKIQDDEICYWRGGRRNTFRIYQRLQNDVVVKPNVYLQNFNALIEGHQRQFRNLLQPEVNIGEIIALKENEQYENEVVDKMGIVLLVRTEENNLKIILEDDAYPRRSV